MASTGGKRPHQMSFMDDEIEEFRVFVRDVQDNHGHKRALHVKPWTTIKDIKDRLSSILSIPPSSQRLFYGPSQPLKNNRTLNDVGVYKSGATLLLDIVGRPVPHQSVTPTNSCPNSPKASFSSTSRHIHFPPNPDGCSISVTPSLLPLTSRSLLKTITQTDRAFSMNLKPLATLDGSGGTYILRAPTKQNVAVFKPSDEEPYASNNPRGFLPSADITMRTGHIPGTGCYREVAAYLLDHGGLCGVPETTLAEASHRAFNVGGRYDTVASGGGAKGTHSIVTPAQGQKAGGGRETPMKLGSFQAFVQSDCTMDDISPSVIPTYEVQKIALLDIRIMNADRNAANLLARRRRASDGSTAWSLVPIDHGYCLRNKADVAWCDWCWLDYPQVKKPLSKKLRQYIINLDVEKDVSILKDRLNIDDATCDVFRASCNLLIKGVQANLSLYEIANMCCRTDDLGETPSTLEKILLNAADLSYHAVDNEKFSHRVASRAIMTRLSVKQPNMTDSSSTTTLPNALKSPEKPNLHYMPSVLSTSSDSDSSDEPVLRLSDSDASRSPGGFWASKRPSSPVKEPLLGSFTEDSSMPGFSLESPVRTTGCGVLKDVYLAHSTAKLRSSLSAQELANMGNGWGGERATVLGITRSCSMEGEVISGVDEVWGGGGVEKDHGRTMEEEIVSAAKALTFVDGEVGAGGGTVEQPKLVKSRSYSALNNFGSSVVGEGSNLARALSGSRSSVRLAKEKGFVGAGWTKKKEELVRTYFHSVNVKDRPTRKLMTPKAHTAFMPEGLWQV
ncbi:hypothetical protein TrRE_jg5096 [Triparma retinervis]|uniref:Ubiquitin-like domain-containing protein n=1 Tax=Triparma retinervis TaxID=2557542 RepID=A0A9W6ZI41_9STRA|nr:hypothetical protein TrRE_jg5096 [Triparma retinervis]